MRVGTRSRGWGAAFALASCVAVAATGTSCGGGGGGQTGAAKPMVLIEFLLVDRALRPSFPTGVTELPRNAEIIFKFSELVNPATVDTQTIAIRFGPQFQSVPKGGFQVDSDRVIFDPTITQQGTPNPFGFEPGIQYNVELPSVADATQYPGGATAVVRNLDNDPLLTSFRSTFTTSDKYLRELTPPEVISVTFIPAPDPLTKQIPGNGIMAIKFTEAMDPASFVLAVGPTVATGDTVDIRYTDENPNPNVNTDGQPGAPTPTGVFGNELKPIPGSFSYDPSATTYLFKPTFSFGDKKYIFSVYLFQGLKDLAGNLLINPRSFGPFVCDGTGRSTGRTLTETFDTTVDRDPTATSADWGLTTPGQLQGAAITSRRAIVAGYQLAEATGAGKYQAVFTPLIGAQINQYVVNLYPPSNLGSRVMETYRDSEIGANGTVTTISWGPDSNATFAALYPNVILRIGLQSTNTMSLAPTFSGNFQGTPLIVYQGPYSVTQKADVGNETGITRPTHQYTNIQSVNPDILFQAPPNWDYGCYTPAAPLPRLASGATPPPTLVNMMDCLYIYTGYVNWPALTSYFDWDEGDPTVAGDSVLVFDASVQEGDTFQLMRSWYARANPGSTALLPAQPLRYMRTTYESDQPDPPAGYAPGLLNPEPSLSDTAFTITKRISIAQTRFYTPDAVDPAGVVFPGPFSGLTTFGTKSDYLTPVISPASQAGGATILMEFQGATALDPISNRTLANLAFPFTTFRTNINDCDTYPYIRWRMTLTSNLNFNTIAKVGTVVVPIVRLP